MSIANPIGKLTSNHAIIQLEEIKDMKIDRWKCVKTHDTKVSFDTVQSKSPQIVSSSYLTNLNSELTLIHVKNNNWKLKSAFNNNNNKKKIKRLGRLVLWCHTETSLHEEDICHSYKKKKNPSRLFMENKKKKLEIINMSSNFSHFHNVLIFWSTFMMDKSDNSVQIWIVWKGLQCKWN